MMTRYIPDIKGCFTCPHRQYESMSGLSHCKHPETHGRDVSGWEDFPKWCKLPKEDDIERLDECVAKNDALNKIVVNDIEIILCLRGSNEILRELLLKSNSETDEEFGDDPDFVEIPELNKILLDHHNAHDQALSWREGIQTIIDDVKRNSPVKAQNWRGKDAKRDE